jgi:hypothetical protein
LALCYAWTGDGSGPGVGSRRGSRFALAVLAQFKVARPGYMDGGNGRGVSISNAEEGERDRVLEAYPYRSRDPRESLVGNSQRFFVPGRGRFKVGEDEGK